MENKLTVDTNKNLDIRREVDGPYGLYFQFDDGPSTQIARLDDEKAEFKLTLSAATEGGFEFIQGDKVFKLFAKKL